MENCWRYYLSMFLLFLLCGCDHFSNETYHHLEQTERRKLSSDYVSLAHTTYDGGSPKRMKLLEKATRLDPRNEQAWAELASPYLLRGMYDEWHNHMDKAIDLHPEEMQARRGRDKLFYFRDYAGALYDFDVTDTLTVEKPDYIYNTSVDYLRGLCYYGLKNHKKSKEYFNKYIKTENEKTGSKQIDNTAFLYLGMIANNEQDYDAAISILEKGLEQGEELADHHYQIAFAHFMSGDAQTAIKSITLCHELFDTDDFQNNRFYEVINQLYQRDIDALKADIECFL